MTALSMGSIIAIGERFPWSEYRTVADIGCAESGLPVHLARRHPHLSGVGLDLPALASIFDEHVAAAGLSTACGFWRATSWSTSCRPPTCWCSAMSCTTGAWTPSAC